MHFLDTVTIACAGLMVGNELAVSAFVNPAVWQLADDAQMKALSILAASLGRVMPFWYGLCLVLLALESYLHRHEAAAALLLTATAIWAGIIVVTICLLVPINNRIAALNTAVPMDGWKREHKKWDSLHRARIVLLTLAFLALTYALVG